MDNLNMLVVLLLLWLDAYQLPIHYLLHHIKAHLICGNVEDVSGLSESFVEFNHVLVIHLINLNS